MGKLSELVGARIKSLRVQKGLSQDQLSSKSNVERTFIANLELGKKNVTIDILVKITDALEISLSDFFNVLQPNIVEDGKDSSARNSIIKILAMNEEQQKDISDIISILSKWIK